MQLLLRLPWRSEVGVIGGSKQKWVDSGSMMRYVRLRLGSTGASGYRCGDVRRELGGKDGCARG